MTKQKTLNLPSSLFGKQSDDLHSVIVSGDGMKCAGIHDGDYLIIDSNLSPKNGDIVEATVNGTHMCCRYFRKDRKCYFRTEDGITGDIVTKEYTIHGVMVGLLRKGRSASPAYNPEERITPSSSPASSRCIRK